MKKQKLEAHPSPSRTRGLVQRGCLTLRRKSAHCISCTSFTHCDPCSLWQQRFLSAAPVAVHPCGHLVAVVISTPCGFAPTQPCTHFTLHFTAHASVDETRREVRRLALWSEAVVQIQRLGLKFPCPFAFSYSPFLLHSVSMDPWCNMSPAHFLTVLFYFMF